MRFISICGRVEQRHWKILRWTTSGWSCRGGFRAALRRNGSFYMPLHPASSQTPYSSLRRRRQSSSIPLLLLSPQNLRFCGGPLRPVGFCFSKILNLCHPNVTKSACPTAAEKRLSIAICPHSRWRSQPLSSVSGRKRYNTLDFPKENRVPTGMLAPLLETLHQRGRGSPVETSKRETL